MAINTAYRTPVLFIGHGNPMNAIEDNIWSRKFEALAAQLPTPQAILCISAHWYGPGTRVTGDAHPSTIHDFGGFPTDLFRVQYPAPGDPNLAQRIVDRLHRYGARVSLDWGLDHGSWSVLKHLRPHADVPVLQLSVDQSLSPAAIMDLGKALNALRNEGVFILGSGNITHNLRDVMTRWGATEPETPEWASSFDTNIATALEQHDTSYLMKTVGTAEFRQSHPTPDHYLPLLYTAGAVDSSDRVSFPITGFDFGSLSMRAVLFTPEAV